MEVIGGKDIKETRKFRVKLTKHWPTEEQITDHNKEGCELDNSGLYSEVHVYKT